MAGIDEMSDDDFDGPVLLTPREGRCGFAALIGAPNAGKSTLLNQLVGSKISIVSHKVQTTRTRITAIAIEGDSQVIFLDTPGIFKPKRRLDRAMVNAAWTGAEDADITVLLIDAAANSVDTRNGNLRLQPDVEAILGQLKDQGKSCILALNKVDLVKRDSLLALADGLNKEVQFSDIFMISAETGDGVADLKKALAERMPEGVWHYPEDQLADIPMRLLAAEITREKIYQKLHEELPYATTVETEKWEERKDGSVKIDQVVFVERDGQKKIVLGKGGKKIREIGQLAREELKSMLERDVHLFLFVKVREKWGDDPERYKEMGLDWSK